MQLESGEIQVQEVRCRDTLLALLGDGGMRLRLPPVCPRQKLPVTLLAAGGHDPSWHSVRCKCLKTLYSPCTPSRGRNHENAAAKLSPWLSRAAGNLAALHACAKNRAGRPACWPNPNTRFYAAHH